MHDLDRIREKIEIRLEPRQVVWLAVATMLFSGGLFAAGFMVGQRQAVAPVEGGDLAALEIEARGAQEEPAPSTPARALGEVEFLFPSVLGSRPARRKATPKPMRLPTSRVGAGAAKRAATPKKVSARPKPRRVVRRPKVEPPQEDRPAPRRVRPKPAPVPEPVRRAAPKPAPRPVVKPAAPAPALDEDAPRGETPRAKATPKKRQLTLQVKAVKDKAEADRFISALRSKGFTPQLSLASVPGKGRYYRVRVGRFDDMDAARRFQRDYKARSGQPDGGFITDD
jgi:DedD protein